MVTRIRHFTLGGYLFGGVKLTKNGDPGKYSYSGCGIGFDTRGYYYLHDGRVNRKVMILAVDMSSSVQMGNKGKDILILGKGPAQGLNHTLIAEIQNSINFTRPRVKFCLILHYNGRKKRFYNKTISFVFSKYFKKFHSY